MANIQDLQVMSPTEEASSSSVGNASAMASAARPPTASTTASSMDISPLHPTGNAGRNPQLSPTKVQLKNENDKLREELMRSDYQLRETNEQAWHALQSQTERFESVAKNYEQHARDVRDTEVAQSEVKIHRQMQSALQAQGRELNAESQRLRATRSEAQRVIEEQRNHIATHAENVLRQRTQEVSQRAQQTLQQEQAKLAKVEDSYSRHVDSIEQRAEKEVMQKNFDLQRQAQDILQLQRAISALEAQASDISMDSQSTMMAEQQSFSLQMQTEMAEWAKVKNQMATELASWKNQAQNNHNLYLQNMERTRKLEEKLKHATDFMSAPSAGSNLVLEEQLEAQMDEIQNLMEENERQRTANLRREQKNTEEMGRLRGELEALKKKEFSKSFSAGLPPGKDWTQQMPSPIQPPKPKPPVYIPKTSGMNAEGNFSKVPEQKTSDFQAESNFSDFPSQTQHEGPRQSAQQQPDGFRGEASDSTWVDPRAVKEAEKCVLDDWPSALKYRLWLLAQKKKIATGSGRPQACFIWIGKVTTAQTMEELEDSEDFPTWDAKLAVGAQDICKGEFYRRIQVMDERAAREEPPRMLKGRQILWLIVQKFKRDEVDGSMQDITDLQNVELKGDNLHAFLNDWDYVLEGIDEMPSERQLERLFFTQLSKSKQLEHEVALYKQDINHKGAERSYERLRKMVEIHLDRKNKDKISAAMSGGKNGRNATPGSTVPKKKSQSGICHQWKNKGKCSRGDSCPWQSTHTEENKGQQRGRSQSREKKGGRQKKEKKGSDSSRGSSGSGDAKPKKMRGKSPSGQEDRPACTKWKKGKCDKGDECNYWHTPDCTRWKNTGKCKFGDKCAFRHLNKPKKKATPVNSDNEAGGNSGKKKKNKNKKGNNNGKKEKKKKKGASASPAVSSDDEGSSEASAESEASSEASEASSEESGDGQAGVQFVPASHEWLPSNQ